MIKRLKGAERGRDHEREEGEEEDRVKEGDGKKSATVGLE